PTPSSRMRALRLVCRNARRCSLITTPVRASSSVCQSWKSACDMSVTGRNAQTPADCIPSPWVMAVLRRLQPASALLYQASGRVKPDTDLRISLAILARLPMLLAVAVVPDDVCEVISWITFMVLEIWPAEEAC